MLSFQQEFSLFPFTLIMRLFISSPLSFCFLSYHLYIWGCWCFSQQPWCQVVIRSPGIFIVFSTYVSHKQSYELVCHSPFPAMKWLIVPCLVPFLVSWLMYGQFQHLPPQELSMYPPLFFFSFLSGHLVSPSGFSIWFSPSAFSLWVIDHCPGCLIALCVF